VSKKRHTVHVCPRLPSAVTALAYNLAHGHTIPEHLHPEDQLVYASQGVMTVKTSEGIWGVPPQRAVWIPARTPHTVATSGAVSMRTLYLRAGMVASLPRSCSVVNVSPLLQELIVQMCRHQKLSRKSRVQAHLIDVLIDQLHAVKTVPLQLPNLSDMRAARVAMALQQDVDSSRSLSSVCRQAGASRRTIERIFRQETKLSLGRWRQQLRLLRSLELLAGGHKIEHAALKGGYSTPSAFIAMFKKALGTTPRKYFQNARETRADLQVTSR
jgi:AraC-like DNA-binding protein